MIKISEHFTRAEFSCKCNCGFNTVDAGLIDLLEEVRNHFDKPVVITSGCRCPEYNERVGGSAGSQHKLGRAADIIVADTDPEHVYAFLDFINKDGGVGNYSTFTHCDSRSGKARWEG